MEGRANWPANGLQLLLKSTYIVRVQLKKGSGTFHEYDNTIQGQPKKRMVE